MKVEVVPKANLLGTHITTDLKWDKNTYEFVKKAHKRMQLLKEEKKLQFFYKRRENQILMTQVQLQLSK